MVNPEPSSLPLLFTFKQIVLGDGFAAGVRMKGRALLENEDGECWITGVSPVGITGGGGDRAVALTEFRNAWSEVLFDLSADSSSFEEFKEASRRFLSANQQSITDLWDGAVRAVRQQGYVDASLGKGKTDHSVEFEVVEIQLETTGNQLDNGVSVAA